MIQFDTQFSNLFDFHIRKFEFAAHPAIVVGVDELSLGLISVQPITSKPNLTDEYIAYPSIQRVPILTYSTQTSRITLPVTLGDTVLLLFTKHNNDEFVAGNIEIHEAPDFGIANLNNAVAILGFNTVLDSPFDNVNYSNNLDFNNLNIVHNADTEKEVVLSLTQDGGVSIKAKEFKVQCENYTVEASTKYSVKSPMISENGI